MSRRGDRIVGRRAHGGVLFVPCLVNATYRYWFLADTGAAFTMISDKVASEMELGCDQAVAAAARRFRPASTPESGRPLTQHSGWFEAGC